MWKDSHQNLKIPFAGMDNLAKTLDDEVKIQCNDCVKTLDEEAKVQ